MTEPHLKPRQEDVDVSRRFRAAGVVIPADRAEGAHAAALRLLSSLHWLRKSRGAAAEPAHVFSLQDHVFSREDHVSSPEDKAR